MVYANAVLWSLRMLSTKNLCTGKIGSKWIIHLNISKLTA